MKPAYDINQPAKQVNGEWRLIQKHQEKPFIKVGMTNKASKKRLWSLNNDIYSAQLWLEIHTKFYRAYEELIFAELKEEYHYRPNFPFGGDTECLRLDCMAVLYGMFQQFLTKSHPIHLIDSRLVTKQGIEAQNKIEQLENMSMDNVILGTLEYVQKAKSRHEYLEGKKLQEELKTEEEVYESW
tara:strand:- start:4303 stop:4854 length:552 start_codon:yes stop_codon:yes gene_type:complete